MTAGIYLSLERSYHSGRLYEPGDLVEFREDPGPAFLLLTHLEVEGPRRRFDGLPVGCAEHLRQLYARQLPASVRNLVKGRLRAALRGELIDLDREILQLEFDRARELRGNAEALAELTPEARAELAQAVRSYDVGRAQWVSSPRENCTVRALGKRPVDPHRIGRRI